MKDFKFPASLLKVCEKKVYVDELLTGKIYMNVGVYFRKVLWGYAQCHPVVMNERNISANKIVTQYNWDFMIRKDSSILHRLW